LLLTRRVDWEKDGPSNNGTNQTNGKEDLEETQEEVVVERRVHQNVVIVKTAEVFDPSKLGIRGFWCVFAGLVRTKGRA